MDRIAEPHASQKTMQSSKPHVTDKLLCDGNHPHISKNDVVYTLPPAPTLAEMAKLFKVFGDTTRMKIISLLLEKEMCVCDIAAFVGMDQSAISHQLRVLKEARLVKYRREGKTVYYSLDDSHVRDIFIEARNHIQEPHDIV